MADITEMLIHCFHIIVFQKQTKKDLIKLSRPNLSKAIIKYHSRLDKMGSQEISISIFRDNKSTLFKLIQEFCFLFDK